MDSVGTTSAVTPTVGSADYVRICPVCERENPPGLARCACGAALGGVDFSLRRTESVEASPPASSGAPPTATVQTSASASGLAGLEDFAIGPEAAGPLTCTHADCGQPNPSGSVRCVYCNRPLQSQAAPPLAAANARPLPSALRGEYRVVDVFPATGAEADLLLVEPTAGGDRFVAKLYRAGLAPDARLLETLAAVEGDSVVRIVAHGVSDGVAYELLEYLPGGTLRDLLAAGPVPLVQVRRIVAELADGLAGIHARNVLHRDLKPENVLLRSRAPLELALSDFGIASLREATQIFTGGARTARYAAPEALTGVLDDKSDWWALGMIALEATVGRHPFEGLSEQVINHHLATRPVDLRDVHDPALAMLCRGLLRRDPKRRWGGAEVARWLAGDATLEAPDDGDPTFAAGVAYRIGPVECRTITELAVAFARDWDAGARDLARGQVTRWVEQELHDHNLARRLADLAERRSQSDDMYLARFLRLVAPDLPPVWRGQPISRASLLAAAHKTMADDVPALRWLDSIAREQVLALYGSAQDGDLAVIDQRWRDGWERFGEIWRAADAAAAAFRRDAANVGTAGSGKLANMDHLMYGVPTWQALPRQELVNGPLLLWLLEPGFADRLRAEITAAQAELGGYCRWFDGLRDAQGGDPLSLLVARALLPYAREDAAAERKRQAAARSARERDIAELRTSLRAQLALIDGMASRDRRLEPETVALLLAALEEFEAACRRAMGLGYPDADYELLCRGAEKLAGHALSAQEALAQCERLRGINAIVLRPQRVAVFAGVVVALLATRIPWLVLACALLVGAVVAGRWYVIAMATHQARKALRWLQLHAKTLGS